MNNPIRSLIYIHVEAFISHWPNNLSFIFPNQKHLRLRHCCKQAPQCQWRHNSARSACVRTKHDSCNTNAVL